MHFVKQPAKSKGVRYNQLIYLKKFIFRQEKFVTCYRLIFFRSMVNLKPFVLTRIDHLILEGSKKGKGKRGEAE